MIKILIRSSAELLQELLPGDMDAQVVLQLPSDVQKAVLADYGILSEDSCEGRHFSLMTLNVSTRSRSSVVSRGN